MSDNGRRVGHHLHQNFIGYEVTVRTPGDIPRTGLLVAVGTDRLVLGGPAGVMGVARLLTTRLEVAGDTSTGGDG